LERQPRHDKKGDARSGIRRHLRVFRLANAYKSQLTLGGRVGGGQFGDVYEGQDQVHGKVAVKVLKQKTGESTADWAARSTALLKEAQHLKAAAHPNIVQVHNIVRDSNNDVLHLVTEFCDGGSIDTPYQNGRSRYHTCAR